MKPTESQILQDLISGFDSIKDPIIERKKLYLLNELLFLILCATISGYSSWETIVDFGEAKLEWLRKYLRYENGKTP
jgi:hypothetical protein